MLPQHNKSVECHKMLIRSGILFLFCMFTSACSAASLPSDVGREAVAIAVAGTAAAANSTTRDGTPVRSSSNPAESLLHDLLQGKKRLQSNLEEKKEVSPISTTFHPGKGNVSIGSVNGTVHVNVCSNSSSSGSSSIGNGGNGSAICSPPDPGSRSSNSRADDPFLNSAIDLLQKLVEITSNATQAASTIAVSPFPADLNVPIVSQSEETASISSATPPQTTGSETTGAPVSTSLATSSSILPSNYNTTGSTNSLSAEITNPSNGDIVTQAAVAPGSQVGAMSHSEKRSEGIEYVNRDVSGEVSEGVTAGVVVVEATSTSSSSSSPSSSTGINLPHDRITASPSPELVASEVTSRYITTTTPAVRGEAGTAMPSLSTSASRESFELSKSASLTTARTTSPASSSSSSSSDSFESHHHHQQQQQQSPAHQSNLLSAAAAVMPLPHEYGNVRLIVDEDSSLTTSTTVSLNPWNMKTIAFYVIVTMSLMGILVAVMFEINILYRNFRQLKQADAMYFDTKGLETGQETDQDADEEEEDDEEEDAFDLMRQVNDYNRRKDEEERSCSSSIGISVSRNSRSGGMSRRATAMTRRVQVDDCWIDHDETIDLDDGPHPGLGEEEDEEEGVEAKSEGEEANEGEDEEEDDEDDVYGDEEDEDDDEDEEDVYDGENESADAADSRTTRIGINEEQGGAAGGDKSTGVSLIMRSGSVNEIHEAGDEGRGNTSRRYINVSVCRYCSHSLCRNCLQEIGLGVR